MTTDKTAPTKTPQKLRRWSDWTALKPPQTAMCSSLPQSQVQCKVPRSARSLLSLSYWLVVQSARSGGRCSPCTGYPIPRSGWPIWYWCIIASYVWGYSNVTKWFSAYLRDALNTHEMKIPGKPWMCPTISLTKYGTSLSACSKIWFKPQRSWIIADFINRYYPTYPSFDRIAVLVVRIHGHADQAGGGFDEQHANAK